MDHAPVLAFIKDVDGRYLYVNPHYEAELGCKAADRLGRKDNELWPEDLARALQDHDAEVLETGKPRTFTEHIPAPGGEQVHRVYKFPLCKDGNIVALGGIALDVTAQAHMQEALRKSEERYRVVAEYTLSWETWVDAKARVLYVSPACETITGFARRRFIEDPQFVKRIMYPEDIPNWEMLQDELAGGGDQGGLDFRIVTPDGQVRWVAYSCRRVRDSQGMDMGIRSSARDITDRKVIESQLRHQALHDGLTGLPNRTLCLDRISQALERSKRRENYHYAVVFLDVDRFKVVNDSLGHSTGDQLLEGVSKRLVEMVRSLDTVARLGGDEFVVVLEEVSSVREALRIARRISRDMSEPFPVGAHTVHITVSMGVVLSPAIYERPEDLLRNANIAMHRAKEKGRNKLKVFNSAMLEQAVKQLDLENELRLAIANGGITIEYQPIVALGEQKVTGFEALARWRHPQRGAVSPAEFIPLAEDTGLIIPLGRLIMEEACKAMAMWRATLPHMAEATLSINVSAKQLSNSEFVADLSRVLRETGLDPAVLKLEITESVLMDNPEVAIVTLRRLKQLGVKLSVDDFGTGYSSLSYLQRFPIDTLKVDQSFVSKMTEDVENQEIIKAVIALAHSLGLDVVAEGVEQDSQCSLLTDLKCESGQGFLFSRPLAPAKVEALTTLSSKQRSTEISGKI